ncbi:MAG: hypothetical protein DRZ79_05955 [Candidatus Cloacimonadota bacterium]|nr:MAG: hypothetical protein DRZ79_05955 [Candidatus Cloacimonadota bacterium]
MKKIIFILVISAMSVGLFSIVFGDYEPSPRARAMGGAYCAVADDAFSIFYNPAGLSFAGNNILLSYTNRFGNDFEKLNTIGFATHLPAKFGILGIGLQSFDVDYQNVKLLSEKTYALSHSFTLQKDVHSAIYFGYVFNLYHLSIDGFGNQPSLGINIGALAILHQRTKIGFSVSNLNNPKVGEDNASELPRKLALGISYEPYSGVITSLELKKTAGDDETEESGTEIHSGVEVKVHKMLALRFGVRTNPSSYSMGARFEIFNILVDYAFNTHILGDTHQFGIGYRF